MRINELTNGKDNTLEVPKASLSRATNLNFSSNEDDLEDGRYIS